VFLNPCLASHRIGNWVELGWMYNAKLDFILDTKKLVGNDTQMYEIPC